MKNYLQPIQLYHRKHLLYMNLFISMKHLQERVKKFCKDNDMEAPIEHRVLDTLSELGEVAKEILKMSNYGKQAIEYRNNLQ